MKNLKVNQEDERKTGIIRKEIHAASEQLRNALPILKFQNFIGMSIFVVSILMVVLSGMAYINGLVNEWFLLFWVAFWTSLFHELEHDLIHSMYFEDIKIIQDIMMLGVWVFKPLTINPWMRRDLHFHHHKASGTVSDFEERALTNGEKWSFKRFLTTADLLLGGLLRFRKIGKELKEA